jgi:hypothetical protein
MSVASIARIRRQLETVDVGHVYPLLDGDSVAGTAVANIGRLSLGIATYFACAAMVHFPPVFDIEQHKTVRSFQSLTRIRLRRLSILLCAPEAS